jgi:hypothetical protein
MIGCQSPFAGTQFDSIIGGETSSEKIIEIKKVQAANISLQRNAINVGHRRE